MRTIRRAVATAVAAALTGTALVVVAPAAAAPIDTEHDFESDAGGWFSYANSGTVATELRDGELCADVAGGANPWDVALQHDGVTYDRDATYRVSFTARSTAAVDVPIQGGAGYPAAFGFTVELPDTEEHRFDFEFSPADWPTGGDSPLAEDWTTVTGNTSFQLGAQSAPYSLCIDDFSITAAGENLVPNGDFADPDFAPWFAGAGLTPTIADGELCVAVPAGGDVYAGVGVNGIAIEQGATYRLAFTARSSEPRTIRVLVGQNGAPYGTVLDQGAVAVGTEDAGYEFVFTAAAGYPATSTDGTPVGQLAFQIGGRSGAYELCLDDVVLTESATPPPPYTPETGPDVRVNQVGYLPEGPKRATLVTEATAPLPWQLVSGTEVVAEGSTEPRGVDDSAGLAVHEIDFSGVTTPGTYTLVADGDTSYGFVIDAGVYQRLRTDALDYFYPARSGIAIDGSLMDSQADGEEYTRDAGHVEDPDSSLVADSVNRGDRNVGCLTEELKGVYWLYGDWECDYTLDVVGGWYDAGDHGKYVVNGGISVAQVMSTYERALYNDVASVDALGDGSLDVPETGNGVPDALDEARWQLEWMMSMQVPADAAQYPGMVHHKIADLAWTGLPLLPADDPQPRYLHRPSTAATLNFAAAAAQGARLWEEYDERFAAELLAAGRVAWEAALATPDLYAPAPNADLSPGSGPYDDDEVGDEFYWAAAELFLATGEQGFEDSVLGSPWHTADLWDRDGFDWGSTAALGRLDLATVDSDFSDRAATRASIVDGADRYLAWQSEEPFGTAYPGTEDGRYQWGSNSMVLNNQVVLGTAFDLTGDQRYADAVVEAMDYLLGRNALNNSFITGYGTVFSENQHSRWFARSLEPTLPNPPVGAIAGGPNSDRGTWDPVITGLYPEERPCAPQACYVDDIQSWSTNEITINWNGALAWVASFTADLGAGTDGAGAPGNDGGTPVVPTEPAEPEPSTEPVPPTVPGGGAGDTVTDPDGDLAATGADVAPGLLIAAAALLAAGAALVGTRRRSRRRRASVAE